MGRKKSDIIGRSGIPNYSGYVYDYEKNPALTGRQKFDIYHEMIQTCPVSGLAWESLVQPLLSSEWVVEPADDSENAVKIATLVEVDLLNSCWRETLREICRYLYHGVYLFEKVYEYRASDGMIHLQGLSARIPQSIEKWNEDDRQKLVSVLQQTVDGFTATIPADRLLIFRSSGEANNWEGSSVLRRSYFHWLSRRTLLMLDSISHERWSAGIPVGILAENVLSGDPVVKDFEEQLSDLRANESAYLVIPHGFDVKFLSSPGLSQGASTLESVKYHDYSILLSVFAQFLLLGETSTGSRSVGETLGDIFLSNIRGIGEYIAEKLNQSVVKELTDLNFGPQDTYPCVRCNLVAKTDFIPLVQSLAGLVAPGILTPDEELESAVRRMLSLPERSFDTAREPEGTLDKEESAQKREAVENSVPDESSDVTKMTEAPPLPAKPFWRLLRRGENEDALLHLQRKYSQAESAVVPQLIDVVEYYTKKELQRYSPKIKRTAVKFPASALNRIVSVLDGLSDDFFTFGAATIEEQLAGVRRMKLSENGQKVDKKHAKKIAASSAETALRIVEEVVSRVFLDGEVFGWSDKDVSDRVNEFLAASYLKRYFGSVVRQTSAFSFSAGREDTVKDLSDQIKYVEYSAIMEDSNTCEVCIASDGRQFPYGSEEMRNNPVPNPRCLSAFGGANKCRCIHVFVFKGEGEELPGQKDDVPFFKEGGGCGE
jgi:hypothetical protein